MKIAQDCAKKQGLAAGSREWLAACKLPEAAHVPSMPEVEVSCQLEHYKTESIDWPFNYLTAGICDSIKLRVQEPALF